MVETRDAENILLATTRMKRPFATIKRGWNGNTKRKELIKKWDIRLWIEFNLIQENIRYPACRTFVKDKEFLYQPDTFGKKD